MRMVSVGPLRSRRRRFAFRSLGSANPFLGGKRSCLVSNATINPIIQASRVGVTTRLTGRDIRATATLDGGPHQVGREEGERDRHIDLSSAAFVAPGNLLDAGDGTGDDLVNPVPAPRN